MTSTESNEGGARRKTPVHLWVVVGLRRVLCRDGRQLDLHSRAVKWRRDHGHNRSHFQRCDLDRGDISCCVRMETDEERRSQLTRRAHRLLAGSHKKSGHKKARKSTITSQQLYNPLVFNGLRRFREIQKKTETQSRQGAKTQRGSFQRCRASASSLRERRQVGARLGKQACLPL